MSHKVDPDNPTTEEIQAVLSMRGGCNCAVTSPPCWNCEAPWTTEEIQALREEFDTEPSGEEIMQAVRNMCR